MNVKILPSNLIGAVTVPASKSVAHRALIAAAFSDKPTVICGRLTGKDVEATISCLCALGAKIEETAENELTVTPICWRKMNEKADELKGEMQTDERQADGKVDATKTDERQADVSKADGVKACENTSLEINAEESGSTLRFILPVLCALGVKAKVFGEGRLSKRPIEGLLDVLSAHGARFDGNKLPLKTDGRLRAGDYVVDGSLSSQYVTGLLLALPLLEGDSTITVLGAPASKGYIDITLDVMREFGVKVVVAANTFFVRGGQGYKSCGSFTVEGDWSNAAFFAVGGVLTGNVTLKGLNQNSLQGDKVFYEVLRSGGADLSFDNGNLIARKSSLHAATFCADDCPDLVPALSVAFAFADGITKISGVDRLRLKESDRLSAVLSMLQKLVVRAEYRPDADKHGEIIIYGKGKYSSDLASETDAKNGAKRGKVNAVIRGEVNGENKGANSVVAFDAHNDHRMAMSSAVAATCFNCESEIVGAECVAKSYPAFFSDFKKLKGVVYED